MTLRPVWLRSRIYALFYRLPKVLRGQLVRRLTPNYTVGAVVLLRDADDRLLLVRQPHAHGWSLPGGLAARREDPAHTAARELAEEVGVRLDISELTPAHPNARVSARSQQVDMVFTARVSADLVLTTDPAEISEAHWYHPQQLPPLTAPTRQLLVLYRLTPSA